MYAGLFLYTKLGLVSGTKFFPNWLKKFPIDLKHSQLAEKSQFKRLIFPILLKLHYFFPKMLLFSQNHTIFSQYHRYQKFPKKVRKSPGMLQNCRGIVARNLYDSCVTGTFMRVSGCSSSLPHIHISGVD